MPGEILALYNAWKIQGRLPWKRLFQPTIDLANNGFKIDEPLAKVIKSTKKIIIKEKGFKYVCFKTFDKTNVNSQIEHEIPWVRGRLILNISTAAQ